jgi:hypothetical protein
MLYSWEQTRLLSLVAEMMIIYCAYMWPHDSTTTKFPASSYEDLIIREFSIFLDLDSNIIRQKYCQEGLKCA